MTTRGGPRPEHGARASSSGLGRLRGDPLRLVLALIAVSTIVSGMAQVIAPGFVLDLLSVDRLETTRQLFATIGMFMTLFGGLMLQALLDAGEHPMIVFWASLQKLGASAAVALGVARDVFAPVALAVASFDLLSALLGFAFWQRVRR